MASNVMVNDITWAYISECFIQCSLGLFQYCVFCDFLNERFIFTAMHIDIVS